MKWEEQQCVFDGQVNSGPGVTWIWAEYIIGLENGNYLLSSEDGEDEIDSSDWSKEVAAEDVVKTFLSGPEGGGGWYNFYESAEGRLESLISAVENIAVAAHMAGDERLVDVVESSQELAELKQELKERLDEERGEWCRNDLVGVIETVAIVQGGGGPGLGWSLSAIVHETINPNMVMIEYPAEDVSQVEHDPMERLDLDEMCEIDGSFEGETYIWSVDRWTLWSRDTYKKKIKEITFGWTVEGWIAQELFTDELDIKITKEGDGFTVLFSQTPDRLRLRDWDGDTLIMHLLRDRSWQEFEGAECVAAIKYLMHEVGIDVNAENDAGESALSIAEAIVEKSLNWIEEPEEKAIWQSLPDVLRGNE